MLRFKYDCRDPLFAKLLREHLYEVMREERKNIARNCCMYLSSKEITELKKTLNKQWNSKTGWKIRGIKRK